MKIQNIQIHETTPAEHEAMMQVEKAAFGQDEEAQLCADLLDDRTAQPQLSLLAFHEGQPIGHILFTRGYIEGQEESPLFHILAPLAVVPQYQKQGIGGMLIQEGLKRLQAMGSQLTFVLGHMEYYPKYGYIPDAKKLGYEAPHPIPEEFKNAWMVQSLSTDGQLKLSKGKIRCADAMMDEKYWRE